VLQQEKYEEGQEEKDRHERYLPGNHAAAQARLPPNLPRSYMEQFGFLGFDGSGDGQLVV